MSGTGFIPSNSNAGTSDASIIEECTDRYHISDNALLVQPLTTVFDSQNSYINLEELVDLSSLELVSPFLREVISLEVLHYRHTFVELCDLGLSCFN